MKRILIIGCCGAGKSTFAKKLHKKLGIELIILDRFYWKPNWEKVDNSIWRVKVQEFISKDEWIIDGNHNSTLDMRLERADTVIFFDMARLLCVRNSLWRYIKGRVFRQKRDCMAAGCKEKIDFDYLKWVWTYNKKVKPRYLEKLNKYQQSKKIIIINDYKQASKFLEGLNG